MNSWTKKEIRSMKPSTRNTSFKRKHRSEEYTVTVRHDVFSKVRKYYGCFSLIINAKMDTITALDTYCNLDLFEKVFGNLKE